MGIADPGKKTVFFIFKKNKLTSFFPEI
jgi:hypothetical protein